MRPLVQLGHELPAVVPGRVITEVLLNDLLSHLALLLQKTLKHLPVFSAALYPLDVGLYDPESVVPAVEVALVPLQELVAQHEFAFKDLGLPVVLGLVLHAELDDPLPVEPEGVGLGGTGNALQEQVKFQFNCFEFGLASLVFFLCKMLCKDLAPVVPESIEVRR